MKILYTPSLEKRHDSRLFHYKQWLEKEKSLSFPSYETLWRWSVDHTEDFWRSLLDYFDVQYEGRYTQVSQDRMPRVKWFEGIRLNYAAHIFRNENAERPALLFKNEKDPLRIVSWSELKEKTAALAHFLSAHGLRNGDRIAAFLPNIPEATISFLAANTLGAIWSCCSQDFGVNAVIERFQQIEPKALITTDGYTYNGKYFPQKAQIEQIIAQLPTLERIISIPYIDLDFSLEHPKATCWEAAMRFGKGHPLRFQQVDFSHPIWVLYSSGTTGKPKAIAHSTGGMLLEHLKYLRFHNDLKAGERFFWYTTTGWMMWNFLQAALLNGATILLYDGSPIFPHHSALWELAQEAKLDHFGASAPFIINSYKSGLRPKNSFDLSRLRSVSVTGSPLPAEGFRWVYEAVKEDIFLWSMSGGTDVCSAFVGGNPLDPITEGEITCRALGCSLYAFDDQGRRCAENQWGEMVITQPMPCMPIFLWGDTDFQRYLESYFSVYAGVWRHGDWIKITERNTLIIQGRSDATLNRNGVRIGTAEIYRALDNLQEIKDSLIVNLELADGRHHMPLFVVLRENLTPDLENKIKKHLRTHCSPRHVPDEIIPIEEVPYTLSGKKMETPVKKILLGIPASGALHEEAMRNPEAMTFFKTFHQNLKKRALIISDDAIET